MTKELQGAGAGARQGGEGHGRGCGYTAPASRSSLGGFLVNDALVNALHGSGQRFGQRVRSTPPYLRHELHERPAVLPGFDEALEVEEVRPHLHTANITRSLFSTTFALCSSYGLPSPRLHAATTRLKGSLSSATRAQVLSCGIDSGMAGWSITLFVLCLTARTHAAPAGSWCAPFWPPHPTPG